MALARNIILIIKITFRRYILVVTKCKEPTLFSFMNINVYSRRRCPVMPVIIVGAVMMIPVIIAVFHA